MRGLLRQAAAVASGGPNTVDFTWFAASRAEPLRTSDAVTGDAAIADDITINRLRWSGSQVLLNRQGAGAMSGWVDVGCRLEVDVDQLGAPADREF